MQQDLFSESKISEQRAPASRVSPYEVLKEERSKVEKIKESSLFGRETESREKNGEGAAFLVPGQKGQDAQPLTEYDPDEILKASTEYFGGDTLAATVWMNKYALKDSDGRIYEKTPDDMHRRIARELHRIESRYPNPVSEEEAFSLMRHFRYIIPQGSPMAGIGNQFQISSLSNCFVVGNRGNSDSYGGIMKIDEEQVQLMKRRGGVGHDLSHIRKYRHRAVHGTLLQFHARGGAGWPPRRVDAEHQYQAS